MIKKSVLIIGALSDIGKSLAHKFALNGYDLQLAARNTEILENHCKDLILQKTITETTTKDRSIQKQRKIP